MRTGELSTFNATGIEQVARPQLKVNLIMTDFKSIYPTESKNKLASNLIQCSMESERTTLK